MPIINTRESLLASAREPAAPTKPHYTLESFNAQQAELYDRLRDAAKPHPNNIACPRCGAELWDTSPTVTLTTDPPQKAIHCPACNYTGVRLA